MSDRWEDLTTAQVKCYIYNKKTATDVETNTNTNTNTNTLRDDELHARKPLIATLR